MKKNYAMVVLVVTILIFGSIALGEHFLKAKELPPIPGSRIKAVEVYGLTPANRIGPVLAKRNHDIPNEKFDYLAFSEILPIGTFEKESYDKEQPGNYSRIEKNRQEGIEVVQIYTNNPNVDISRYCH